MNNKNLNKKAKRVLAKSMALFILGGAGATAVANSSIEAEASANLINSIGYKKGYITGVGKGYRLNVRSGAGTSYYPVGQVIDGTYFTVLSKSGNWYKIRTETSTKGVPVVGYVRSDFVKVYSQGGAVNSGIYYVKATINTHVYNTNTTGVVKTSLKSVSAGEKLAVVGEDKTFYKVSFRDNKGNAKTGYIYKSYTKKI